MVTSSLKLDRLALARFQYRLRPPGWRYPLSYHRRTWELYVCWSGQWRVEIDGVPHVLAADEAILIPPRAAHVASTHGRQSALIMLVQFRSNWAGLAGLAGRVIALHRRAQFKARELLHHWADTPEADVYRRALLGIFLVEMADPSEPPNDAAPMLELSLGVGDELVQRVLVHLRENLKRPLSVRKLCRVTGYSASRLRELFRRRTGISMTEALMRLRLEEAQRMLLHTPLKIGAVAREVGFRRAPKFSEFFRRRLGCTPRQFVESGRRLGRTWIAWSAQQREDQVLLKRRRLGRDEPRRSR